MVFSSSAGFRSHVFVRSLTPLLVLAVALVTAACGDGVQDAAELPDSLADSAATDAQTLTDVAQEVGGPTDAVADAGTDALALTDAVAETDVSSGSDAPVATDAAVEPDASPQSDAVVLPDPCSADVDCADPGVPCIVARCVPQPAGQDGPQKVCKLVLLPNATPCDDGQSCTAGETCQAGSCTAGKDVCVCSTSADCVALDDGNPCNGKLYCDTSGSQPVCKTNPATVVTCAGQTGPCSASVCNPASGKCEDQFAPNGTLCNDGDNCTTDDACTDGACKGPVATCECKTTADCADKEDGNLCNGKLYCDTNNFPFSCKVNPATVVQCGTSLDNDCNKNTCNPQTGQCAMQVVADASACSDGNPCTSDEGCLNGKCVATTNTCQCTKNADCAQFEDNNLCNGTLFCNLSLPSPQCEVNPATLIVCPSAIDTECKQNQCDPATGQCAIAAVNENAPCSDGNLCSSGDHCEQGVCVPAAETCDCTEDADCAGFEDGNACNGTLYCDKSAAPFQCRINPATVVACPDGDDTECLQNRCDPASGKCSMTQVNQDGPCDADDFDCTAADSCIDGICVPGANICSCQSGADCGVWEDSDICNGTLYCDKAQQPFVCKVNPATLKSCPSVDDTECVVNRCEPTSGNCVMTPRNNGDLCNADDNACTVGDVCAEGVCEAGTNICACQQDSDCASADDGNLCNGTLYCDKSAQPFSCKLNPASVVTCDPSSDSACNKNTCQPKSGTCAMTTLPDNTACNDGNLCSVSDVCSGGVCAGTNICSCQVSADCAPFDDGNLCNGTLYCDTSALPFACKPDGKQVDCPASSSVCSITFCNPTSGLCQTSADPTAAGQPCDDGDACTSNTTCDGSSCVGSSTVCDDDDPCTFDVCIPGGGCSFGFTAAAPCDDGLTCTQQDKCVVGGCVGAPVYCDDGNVCTADQCQEGKGCVSAPINASCNDGNPCTIKDSCTLGSCEGLPKNCNDGNVCTDDTCASLSGACLHLPIDPTPCDDGLGCTVQDICSAGACTGKPLCDDNNPCTADTCLEGLPCSFAPLTGGLCSDGDPCTASDKCQAGICKGDYACDDGNPCTKDSCDLAVGCTAITLDSGPCEDDDVCTETGTCVAGSCEAPPVICAGDFCSAICLPDVGCAPIIPCDDNNACTSDSCDELAGCLHVANLDGSPCLQDDKFGFAICDAGSCGACQRDSLRIYADYTLDMLPTAALFDGQNYFVAGTGVALGSSEESGYLGAVDSDGGVAWTQDQQAPGGASVNDVADVPGGILAFGYRNAGDDFEGQAWVASFDKLTGTALETKNFGEEAQSEAFHSAVQIGPANWLVAGTVGSGPDAGNLLLVRVDLPLAIAGSKMIGVPGGLFQPKRILAATTGQAFYVVGTRDTGVSEEAHVVAVDASLNLLWQQSYPLADSYATRFRDAVLRSDAQLLCVGERDVGGGQLPIVVAIATNLGLGNEIPPGAMLQGGWESVRAWGDDFLLLGVQQASNGDNVVLAARASGVDGSLQWSSTYAAGEYHQHPRWVYSMGSVAFATQVLPDAFSEPEAWIQELDPQNGEAWCPAR